MAGAPNGFHTITPRLVLKEAAAAIELYKRVFGAVEIARILVPGSDKVFHAVISIGDSKIFLVDQAATDRPPAPAGSIGGLFYLYVDDVDAQHKKAKAAGMNEIAAPADMSWGDRMSVVSDRYGQEWSLATRIAR